MKQIIADIDSSVKKCSHSDEMLSTFFYTTNKAFQDNSTFAKIFFKEQTHTVNENLLNRLTYYDNKINDIILYIIDYLVLKNENTKYDLLICIKGFMKVYVDLFLIYELPLIDLDVLTKSLVEKTNILAKHSTIPFITKESAQVLQNHIKGEDNHSKQIIELIDQLLHDIEEPIEKESLELLKNMVQSENNSLAIIKGLLENVKNNPQCKWVSYLIREKYSI